MNENIVFLRTINKEKAKYLEKKGAILLNYGAIMIPKSKVEHLKEKGIVLLNHGSTTPFPKSEIARVPVRFWTLAYEINNDDDAIWYASIKSGNFDDIFAVDFLDL